MPKSQATEFNQEDLDRIEMAYRSQPREDRGGNGSRGEGRGRSKSTRPVRTRVFRPFMALYGNQKARLFGAAVTFVIKASPTWVLPIVTAEIVNAVSIGGEGALPTILLLSAILVVFLLQNIPMHVLFVRLLNGTIRSMEARTRYSLARRLQQLSLGFHESKRGGELQTKVLRDVENIGVMTSHLANTMVNALITVAVAVLVTMQKKPELLLFYLLTIPLSVAIVRVFGSRMQENTRRFRQALEGMSVRITEMLHMLPITRAHALENVELSRMAETLEEVRDTGKKVDIWNGLFGATAWVFFQVFQLSALVVSAYLALQGQIPIGDIILYQSFFSALVGSINAMVNVLPELSRGFESVRSIGEVLCAPDIELNVGRERMEALKGDIAFRGVSFTYPGATKPALQDISFTASRGKTIAFVGESGSGKSTLMSLLIGFHRPQSGEIYIDDKPMTSIDMRDFRRQLSVVTQQSILFSGSIRDNIAYGTPDADESMIWEALEQANAAHFVRELEGSLDANLGDQGSKLSGGQKQRLAIARAMLRDPTVIILDEATSALDTESERLVQEALDRLRSNRTTFIIAHRLSTIQNADEVIVLSKGSIVEQGPIEVLLAKKGVFFKLWNLSMSVADAPVNESNDKPSYKPNAGFGSN